jgi:hypothetical protein
VSRRRSRASRDAGYIAVITVILAPVIFGISALTIDVGNWYFVVQKVQRAADAAALAGVTYMPGDLAAAKAQALTTAAANGYSSGVDPEPVAGQPSKLRVTITTTVQNTFGQLLGVDQTTIQRTSVASYQAPLPMGSPCNEFGNGPDPTIGAVNERSPNCAAAGEFWANVGSPNAPKSNGDAYQDANCGASAGGTDNCAGGTNSDYQSSGYFYSITLSHAVSGLTIQSFDPAFVSVGDLCSANFGSGTTAASLAKNEYNYNAGTAAGNASYKEDSALYASGQTSAYCTGDQLYTQSGQVPDTTYTVRQPGQASNPWDPTSFPVTPGCTKTFTGFTGSLYPALNEYQQSNGVVKYSKGVPVLAPTGPGGYQPQVASEFRQWVTLCSYSGTVAAGTYFVQVQGNAPGDNPSGDGHNRFALRAFGASPGDASSIAISGFTNMAIYADLPSAHTTFHLTRVSPAAGGQVLDVSLFDIGDSSQPGVVTIKPPSDSNVSTFSGCVGKGPTSGVLRGCSIPANSSYNGKWEQLSIPLPSGFTCDYSSPTGCWILLSYDYGGGQPSDTTSWTAALEGTPVRLTE